MVAIVAAVAVGILTGDGSPSAASGAAVDAHIALLAQPESQTSSSSQAALPDAMAAGGYDVAGARQALTLSDGERFVAARRSDPRLGSGDLICGLTVAKDGGSHGGCTSIADFNERGIASVSGSASDVQLVGLVPDGVATVTVSFADGTSQSLGVQSNAYALRSDIATETVSFDGPDGSVTRAITPVRG